MFMALVVFTLNARRNFNVRALCILRAAYA